jgi:hypothetical protein
MGLRAFTGLNHDSRMPGLASPGLVGGVGIPAGIKVVSETSWYAAADLALRSENGSADQRVAIRVRPDPHQIVADSMSKRAPSAIQACFL